MVNKINKKGAVFAAPFFCVLNCLLFELNQFAIN
jgi:hypothetical protein